MRKIVFFAHADTVGTDHAELVQFNSPITDKQLDEYCQEVGQEHANSYDQGEYGGEDDDYEDESQYLEQCGWWWEEYDAEKHDGLTNYTREEP